MHTHCLSGFNIMLFELAVYFDSHVAHTLRTSALQYNLLVNKLL